MQGYKLEQSPIYHMSLGSMELFHSNFWYWLMNKDKNITKAVFFHDIDLDKKITIKREDKRRDIVIYNGNSKYVIENKFKSLPSKEQLIKYTEDNNFKGIITGIIEPDFKLDGWSFLSYKVISQKLSAVIQTSQSFTEFERTLALEYCDVIDNLNKLLIDQLNMTNNVLSYHCKNLEQYRLEDLYRKLKGNDFLTFFKKQNLESLQVDGYELHFNQDFNRKSVTLELCYKSLEDKLKIGVQLHGMQYRLFAHEKYHVSFDEIFNRYASIGWFDASFNKKDKTIFGHATNMKPRGNNQYNKYSSKYWDYNFVYQYYPFYDIEYKTLSEIIVKDLMKLKNLIIKHKL